MTNNVTKTYEQIEMERIKRENEELKRKLAEEAAKKRKKEASASEEALYGFMAGRVGNGYSQWASGEI